MNFNIFAKYRVRPAQLKQVMSISPFASLQPGAVQAKLRFPLLLHRLIPPPAFAILDGYGTCFEKLRAGPRFLPAQAVFICKPE